MLGFDALGKEALGQLPLGFFLPAVKASFAVTGKAASFRVSESGATGVYSVIGKMAAFQIRWPVSKGSFFWEGFNANQIVLQTDPPGSFIITGIQAELTRDFVNWARHPAPSAGWGLANLPSSIWTPTDIPMTIWTVDPDQVIPPPEER